MMGLAQTLGSPIRNSLSTGKATPIGFFTNFFILTVTESINSTLHAPKISYGGVN